MHLDYDFYNNELKNLNVLHLKYHKLFKVNSESAYLNDLALLRQEEAEAYLLELNKTPK